MSLSSKSVAVITGAASGIGRALAVRLAREKIAGIAISDVNENGLNETVSMIEKLNVPVSAHIVDVSKLEEVERFKSEVLEKHSRVTHLINNAGVGLFGNFEQISLEDFQWLMSINFWGVVYGCKVFLPILKQQEKAHIGGGRDGSVADDGSERGQLGDGDGHGLHSIHQRLFLA
jgi:NAD(P)-dependent dehydrogenase (short-subunit alcohol dehydrogenase family)